jgi:6-phosphogluconolactonase
VRTGRMAIERTAKSLSDRVLANHNVDTRGIHTRTFGLDPSGRILVAANMMQLPVRNATSVSTVPASLAVFRVRGDGKLDFVRKYDVAVGGRNMFWMGITALP